MKKRIEQGTLLMVYAVLVILFPVSAACAQEESHINTLVINSGVEEIEAGRPIAWYPVGDFPQTQYYIDEVTAASGKNSLAITNTDTEVLRTFGPPNWAQDITLVLSQDTVVTLSALVKTYDVQGMVAVAAQCWKGGEIISFGTTQHTRVLSLSNPWTKVSVAFKIPRDTEKLRILCMLAGTGAVWFDDVTLLEGGSLSKSWFLFRFKVPLSPGQIVGLCGGIIGLVVGILGAVFGVLCGRNREKYYPFTRNLLIGITLIGGLSLCVGVYGYMRGLFHPDYCYGFVLVGGVLLFVGSLNLLYQRNYQKRIEGFKDDKSGIE